MAWTIETSMVAEEGVWLGLVVCVEERADVGALSKSCTKKREREREKKKNGSSLWFRARKQEKYVHLYHLRGIARP